MNRTSKYVAGVGLGLALAGALGFAAILRDEPSPPSTTFDPRDMSLAIPGATVSQTAPGVAPRETTVETTDEPAPGLDPPPVPETLVQTTDELHAIVRESPPGTVFRLVEGVHTVSHPIEPADDMVFIGDEGAIVSGDDVTPRAFGGAADRVTIQGLTIERFANRPQLAAIQPEGEDWRIIGNEIRENAGAGLRVGSGFEVISNYIHHNHQIGILANGAVDALIADNEIAFNNYENEYEMDWEAGGSKFISTLRLTVRGNYVHHNHGPGLWSDYGNTHTLYESNLVVDNLGPGIFHEISFDAKITGNIVRGNAFDFYVGGILVANSSNVEVFANEVFGNDGGIIAIQEDREVQGLEVIEVRNLIVRENHIGHDVGWTGVLDNTGSGEVGGWNNRFFANTYESDPDRRLWIWVDEELTFDQWRERGLG